MFPANGCPLPSHMDAIGAPEPPYTLRLVGEVLGTSRIPDEIISALLDQFRVTQEDGSCSCRICAPGEGSMISFKTLPPG